MFLFNSKLNDCTRLANKGADAKLASKTDNLTASYKHSRVRILEQIK